MRLIFTGVIALRPQAGEGLRAEMSSLVCTQMASVGKGTIALAASIFPVALFKVP